MAQHWSYVVSLRHAAQNVLFEKDSRDTEYFRYFMALSLGTNRMSGFKNEFRV